MWRRRSLRKLRSQPQVVLLTRVFFLAHLRDSAAFEHCADQCGEQCHQHHAEAIRVLREEADKAHDDCNEREQHMTERVEAVAKRSEHLMQQFKLCNAQLASGATLEARLRAEFAEKCDEEIQNTERSCTRRVKRVELKEWRHHEIAEVASRRATAAEGRLQRALAGHECKAAQLRNVELARDVAEAEQVRLDLEQKYRAHTKESETKIASLMKALEEANAAARMQQEKAAAREQELMTRLDALSAVPQQAANRTVRLDPRTSDGPQEVQDGFATQAIPVVQGRSLFSAWRWIVSSLEFLRETVRGSPSSLVATVLLSLTCTMSLQYVLLAVLQRRS